MRGKRIPGMSRGRRRKRMKERSMEKGRRELRSNEGRKTKEGNK